MATRILHRLLEEEDYDANFLVSTAIYCSVIDAHAKSGRGAMEAEGILNLMLQKYSSEGKVHARPNTVAFNATLDAWSKMPLDNNSNSNSNNTSSISAAERAEELLNWMHFCPYVEPDTISYNAVLVCLTRAGQASRAEALHNVMEKLYEQSNKTNVNLRPNTHTLTTVCNAWARSGASGAAQRAEAILERMERDYLMSQGQCEHLKPNVKTYTCVMDAWAKSMEEDAPQRAEAILNRMAEGIRYFHSNVVLQVEPNVQSYAAVLDAWAKSKYWDKASRARNILMRMKQRYELTGNEACRPNVFCYTAVINAAAFTAVSSSNTNNNNSNDGTDNIVHADKEAALGIAFATLDDLQNSDEYGPPNHVTYTTFLKACANLMPKTERQRSIVQHVFTVACENGQVSRNLFHQYKRLMGDHHVPVHYSIGDIPSSWCCNVKERQYYGRGGPSKKGHNNTSKHHHQHHARMSMPPTMSSSSNCVLHNGHAHVAAPAGGVTNGALSMVRMPPVSTIIHPAVMVTPPGSPDHSIIGSVVPVQCRRRPAAVSMESESSSDSGASNSMMWEWGHVRDNLHVHG